MNTRYTNFFRIFFSFIDIGTLNILYLLIFVMFPIPVSDGFKYLLLFAVMNIAWLGSSYVTALYINDGEVNFERFARRTVQAFLLFILSVFFFIFIFKYSYSRFLIIFSFSGFGIALILSRAFFIWGAGYFINHERFNKKIVILGYNDVSKKLASHFISHTKNISIKGYFEDTRKINELSGFPIIGNSGDCVSYAISNQVSEIYCTIAPEKDPSIYDLAQKAERNFIRFMFVPDFKLFVNRTIHFNYLEDIPILSLRSEPLQEDMAGRIKKRIFDIVFSLCVILLIFPWLIPIVALLIKLESKGPVFFVQMRSGKNNKPFRCFKFRSLHVNKEADSKQVTANDARITRMGKFLRRTNIDELPQFFNVLRGDMAIVGPRPHMLKHTELYSRLLNQFLVRHFLQPGITGWAQVNGLRGETKTVEQMQQRVEHDIWYLENWSMWLDFRIIFMTMFNAIRGEKNAF